MTAKFAPTGQPASSAAPTGPVSLIRRATQEAKLRDRDEEDPVDGIHRRRVRYERTHDIERLTALVSETGLELPVESDELAELTPWAVERRYGDPFDPEPLDRQWAVALVARMEDWAGRAFASPDG